MIVLAKLILSIMDIKAMPTMPMFFFKLRSIYLLKALSSIVSIKLFLMMALFKMTSIIIPIIIT